MRQSRPLINGACLRPAQSGCKEALKKGGEKYIELIIDKNECDNQFLCRKQIRPHAEATHHFNTSL